MSIWSEGIKRCACHSALKLIKRVTAQHGVLLGSSEDSEIYVFFQCPVELGDYFHLPTLCQYKSSPLFFLTSLFRTLEKET
jgi:hypothetical protein